jgi:hypothetical protein
MVRIRALLLRMACFVYDQTAQAVAWRGRITTPERAVNPYSVTAPIVLSVITSVMSTSQFRALSRAAVVARGTGEIFTRFMPFM